MRLLRSFLAGLLFLGIALAVPAADVSGYAARIAPLIDPAKLATLGERGANPRVQKYVAQLAEAQKKHAPVMRADGEVLLVRVEIYLKAGKPDMAQPVAQTLARTCGADWRAHYALAQTEAQVGTFEAARAALERAFALADIRQQALGDPLLGRLWRNLDLRTESLNSQRG